MTDHDHSEHSTIGDLHALSTLDIHYGMELSCTPTDLRRPGWTVLATRNESDPMTLLFGQRRQMYFFSPVGTSWERGGVAMVVPELRAPVAALLRDLSPAEVFAAQAESDFDQRMRATLAGELAAALPLHQHLCYTTATSFRPYLGQWLDWIEPLDETREMRADALGLLARFGRGVYVVRQSGAIAAYAGIRQLSPHIWEIVAQTTIEALRGHGLARAVASRATRAVLAEGRLPLCAYRDDVPAGARIAAALGYRPYADAISYATTLP